MNLSEIQKRDLERQIIRDENDASFRVMNGLEDPNKKVTFDFEPEINVISKEDLEERIGKVFHLLWQKLSKSFGPYGSQTIICNFPYKHVTKDGYTIFKSLVMNVQHSYIDQIITDMVGDICGRLNYSVGDGTTSAVIATNSIYQSYVNSRNVLREARLMPRDIIKLFKEIRDRIIDKLHDKVTVIQTEDREELRKRIEKVVYISSNGDEQLTSFISDLYYELGCPSISCEVSPDGVSRKELIDGYKFTVMLNDRIYINNDENTMKLDEADVVILLNKVTADTYAKILYPLNECSRMRNRHLIVMAPSYDETALSQVIAIDLNNEARKRGGKVNMILMTYSSKSQMDRKIINDFAVLCNTTPIDRVNERAIIEEIAHGRTIESIFNMDSRNIEGTVQMVINEGSGFGYRYGIDPTPDGNAPELIDRYINLGYVRDCNLGLKTSVFGKFFYDESRFKAIYDEAEKELDDAIRKYKKLGTFNTVVSQASQRFYSLRLKMGLLQIGGDSEMSVKMNCDVADDAVKAASSAYNYGIVKGCNTSLIRSINEAKQDDPDKEYTTILYDILKKGFVDVYGTVLSNAFDDIEIYPNMNNEILPEHIANLVKMTAGPRYEGLEYKNDVMKTAIENIRNDIPENLTLHRVLIEYSILTNQVFDVTTKQFSDDVINSTHTDEEILIATIDLISLLITGNQLVITGKDVF